LAGGDAGEQEYCRRKRPKEELGTRKEVIADAETGFE